MIQHHPSAEMLFEYAAGALSEGKALAIAAHCSLCRSCASDVAAFEAVGGALLEAEHGVDVSESALESVLARLDEPVAASKAQPQFDRATRKMLPEPLLRYLNASLSQLPWRSVGRLYEEVRLPLKLKTAKASLMRLKPGTLMPHHGHRGQEWTVVLAGGYHDGGVGFGRGDFDAKDPSHRHQPRVDDDGECLCLVVLDAPVKLSGALGVIVNPFLRI